MKNLFAAFIFSFLTACTHVPDTTDEKFYRGDTYAQAALLSPCDPQEMEKAYFLANWYGGEQNLREHRSQIENCLLKVYGGEGYSPGYAADYLFEFCESIRNKDLQESCQKTVYREITRQVANFKGNDDVRTLLAVKLYAQFHQLPHLTRMQLSHDAQADIMASKMFQAAYDAGFIEAGYYLTLSNAEWKIYKCLPIQKLAKLGYADAIDLIEYIPQCKDKKEYEIDPNKKIPWASRVREKLKKLQK